MDNAFSISGKLFLVTGATSGIGLNCCKYIAENGGNFVGLGRNIKDFPYAGNGNSIYALDLENFVNKDLEFLNEFKFNGIIHAAGIVELLPFQFFNLDLYNKIMRVNVESILTIISHLLKKRLLLKESSIVLVSSISGKYGMKGNGIYGISKSALNLVSKVLAGELSSSRIRTNSVLPGMVKTKMTDKTVTELGENLIKIDESKYPLGYGNVEDVVLPIIFLLSDASKWINGQNIILDGGRTSII